MPAISLVVCVHGEVDLLGRLLREADGCFDDFVVVHDGALMFAGEETGILDRPQPLDFAELPKNAPLPPGYERVDRADAGALAELVSSQGGTLFVGPRCFQQEPHWPFAWWSAGNDWILRFDADEFPSRELRNWLMSFRGSPDPQQPGYTCIWPLWNGKRALNSTWPNDRIFLFDKRRVRFPGMVEEVPIPEGEYQRLPLVLHHQPRRKSFGIRNLVLRKQAYHWRNVIVHSLLSDATNVPRWRWRLREWPPSWEEFRSHPLRTALKRLVLFPVYTAKILLHHHLYSCLYSVPLAGLHHFLIGVLLYWRRSNNQSCD